MGKTKGRKEIERIIVKGHRIGMCDSDGHSYTTDDGRIVAKPKNVLDTRNLRELSSEDTALEKLQSGWIP